MKIKNNFVGCCLNCVLIFVANWMQKPADLEGTCPFLDNEGPCPYGLACRFSGTHKDGLPEGNLKSHRLCSELNVLNKDTQKLLWKNKVKFTKADATLKRLGLAVSIHFTVASLQLATITQV